MDFQNGKRSIVVSSSLWVPRQKGQCLHRSQGTQGWLLKENPSPPKKTHTDSSHTVDGQNPAPPRMIIIPLFIGFKASQVVQDFFHQQYLKENYTQIERGWICSTYKKKLGNPCNLDWILFMRIRSRKKPTKGPSYLSYAATSLKGLKILKVLLMKMGDS